jgi:hypothetical protein
MQAELLREFGGDVCPEETSISHQKKLLERAHCHF